MLIQLINKVNKTNQSALKGLTFYLVYNGLWIMGFNSKFYFLIFHKEFVIIHFFICLCIFIKKTFKKHL